MRITAIAALLLACSALPAQAEDAFRLTSPDIAEGRMLAPAQVMDGFGCAGGNQAPTLGWEHAPKGTQSFALTLYDPDAPTGSGWWHWVVYDIPADTKGLSGAALPQGAKAGRNDYGSTGFGGACPPPGAMHRYRFTLTALDVAKLELPDDASPALIGFMTGAHALASATITAVFTR